MSCKLKDKKLDSTRKLQCHKTSHENALLCSVVGHIGSPLYIDLCFYI